MIDEDHLDEDHPSDDPRSNPLSGRVSSDFRSQALDKFRRDEIIGFCATDTLGMVSLINLYEIYWFIHQVCRAWIFRTSK